MNELIEKQLNNGTTNNPFLSHCNISRPSPLSPRTKQVLNFMQLNQREISPPIQSNKNIDKINQYSKNRQMRYFGAWSLDQWDRAAIMLKDMNLDERVIKTYKDEFIDTLHQDFESGVAYEYADDWFQSFPNGGFFNPVRYNNLYSDEIGIAHRIEEYIQCGEKHPAINGLLSYEKPKQYDHTFLKNAGAYIITYPTESDIHDILESQVYDIGENVAEMIGEDEENKHKQRIFVTDSFDYGDSISTCAVIYSDFDTDTTYLLNNSVKNAIVEAIPVDYWKDSRLSIGKKPYSVTKGELEMAQCNLCVEDMMDIPLDDYYVPSNFSNEKLNENNLNENYTKQNSNEYSL